MHREKVLPQSSIRPDILYVWKGQSMLITDQYGDMSGNGITGYYFRGIRFLKKLHLQVNGRDPYFSSRCHILPDRIDVSMIFPEVKSGGTGGSGSGMIQKQDGILERNIDIYCSFIVEPVSVVCTFKLTNRWEQKVSLTLSWLVEADYHTIGVIEDSPYVLPECVLSEIDTSSVHFSNTQNDLPYKTVVSLVNSCNNSEKKDRLQVTTVLAKSESIEHTVLITAVDFADSISPDEARQRDMALQSWLNTVATVTSSNNQFADVVNNSVKIVGCSALLDGTPDQWLTPAAGYPLYQHLFARDALTTSWMISMMDEGLVAFNSISLLSELQGKKRDDYLDEQPGRIIQQSRKDTLSRLGKVPYGRYYGDYASPLMLVVTFLFAYAWSGDYKKVLKYYDVIRRILTWAEKDGDLDHDGFLEYKSLSPLGPRNQGWKDSENAIVDEFGVLVDPPIAACEVQGYYYAALLAGAFLSFITGNYKSAFIYYLKANKLKKKFNQKFWVDDGKYIALGLDAQKRPIRSKTSNMGHCLATGIIDNAKIPRVVEALMAPDLFSGWGVRTLSLSHPAYNPLDYHLGSVWPVENASIAFGMRRYGFDDEAFRIIKANFDLALQWENNLVPECIGGYKRSEYPHPGAYPKANVPQTWNAAAFAMFTHVLFGFQPFSPLKTLFLDPSLPEWLPQLTIENLHFCGGIVHIHAFRTRTGKTMFEVKNKKGSMMLIRQQPFGSMSISLWRRMVTAAGITN
jgi:glycogen debranching enzyme